MFDKPLPRFTSLSHAKAMLDQWRNREFIDISVPQSAAENIVESSPDLASLPHKTKGAITGLLLRSLYADNRADRMELMFSKLSDAMFMVIEELEKKPRD